MFSMRSEPRCYKQKKLEVSGVESVLSVGWWVRLREKLGLSRCELLLLESGRAGRGQFWNPEEVERPPFEAATKQRQ
jgi:hypothetical protein